MTEKNHQRVPEIAAEVRAALKAEFPDCKFSVRCREYRHITVSLMQAPVSPFAKLMQYSSGFDGERETPFNGQRAQLNHYHIGEKCNGYFLTPEAVTFLQRVSDIGNEKNWDESDPQTDYFNCNYYFDLEVGQWNKPFMVVPAKHKSGQAQGAAPEVVEPDTDLDGAAFQHIPTADEIRQYEEYQAAVDRGEIPGPEERDFSEFDQNSSNSINHNV